MLGADVDYQYRKADSKVLKGIFQLATLSENADRRFENVYDLLHGAVISYSRWEENSKLILHRTSEVSLVLQQSLRSNFNANYLQKLRVHNTLVFLRGGDREFSLRWKESHLAQIFSKWFNEEAWPAIKEQKY